MSVASGIIFFFGLVFMSVHLGVYWYSVKKIHRQLEANKQNEQPVAPALKTALRKIIHDEQTIYHICKSLSPDEEMLWIDRNTPSYTRYAVLLFMVDGLFLMVIGAVSVRVIYHTTDAGVAMLVSVTPPVILTIWIYIAKYIFPTEYYIITNKKLWLFTKTFKLETKKTQQKFLFDAVLPTSVSIIKSGTIDMFVSIRDVTEPLAILEQLGFGETQKIYDNKSTATIVTLICLILFTLAGFGSAVYFWYIQWLFIGAVLFCVGNVCGFLSWIFLESYTKDQFLYTEVYDMDDEIVDDML